VAKAVGEHDGGVEEDGKENDHEGPQSDQKLKIYIEPCQSLRGKLQQIFPVPPEHELLQHEKVNAVHHVKLSGNLTLGNMLAAADGVSFAIAACGAGA
jgi:hypothetical protein